VSPRGPLWPAERHLFRRCDFPASAAVRIARAGSYALRKSPRYAVESHHEETPLTLIPQAGRRKTYPTPRTVWMNCGADGSPSSWLRNQWMCTSTVRVSPA
jgi:hypothetical protein